MSAQDSIRKYTLDSVYSVDAITCNNDGTKQIVGRTFSDSDTPSRSYYTAVLDNEFNVLGTPMSFYDESESIGLKGIQFDANDQSIIVSNEGRSFAGSTAFEGGIHKIDSIGNTVFVKTFSPLTNQGGSMYNVFSSDIYDGYLGTGSLFDALNITNHGDLHLVHVSRDGEVLKNLFLQGETFKNEFGADLTVMQDSSIIIVSEFVPVDDSGISIYDESDILVVKVNSDFTISWSKKIDFGFKDSGGALSPNQKVIGLDNGDLIISSSITDLETGDINKIIFKMSSTGNVIWSRLIGASDFTELTITTQTLHVLKDGSILSTGTGYEASSLSRSIFGVVIDTTGNVRYDFRSSGTEYAFGGVNIQEEMCYLTGSNIPTADVSDAKGVIFEFKASFLNGEMGSLESCDFSWEENVRDINEVLVPVVEDYSMTIKEVGEDYEADIISEELEFSVEMSCKSLSVLAEIEASVSVICELGEEVNLSTEAKGEIEWRVKGDFNVISTENVFLVTPDSTSVYELYENGVLKDEHIIFVNNPDVCFPLRIASPDKMCSGDETVLKGDAGEMYKWISLKDGVTEVLGEGDSIVYTFDQTVTIVALSESGTVTAKVIVEDEECIDDVVKIIAPDSLCLGDSLEIYVHGEGSFIWYDKLTDEEIHSGGNSFFVYSNDLIDGIYVVNENQESDSLEVFYYTEKDCEEGIISASKREYCKGDDITLTYHGPITNDRKWIEISDPSRVLGMERNLMVEPQNQDELIYLFFPDVNRLVDGVVLKKKNDCPIVDILTEPQPLCIGDSILLEVSGDEDGYAWKVSSEPDDTLSTGSSFWYKPKYKVSHLIVDGFNHYRDSLTIELKSSEECPRVFEYVSPNDDGVNDFFKVSVTQDEVVSITIYNQWNQVVYRSDNYLNDWGGLGLPSASYYYVVEIMSDNTVVTEKGTLFLDYE